MNRKSLLLLLILFVTFISSNGSFAYLPASAITQVGATFYAIYTSTDATCQTGLTAIMPMTLATAATNIVSNPPLGTGTIAMPIGCVVVVLKNQTALMIWQAGTYTGMSGTFSDNIAACNSGGTVAASAFCQASSIIWPAQIQVDAANAGVTLSSNCTSGTGGGPTGSEIVPIYLSVNSKCTGVKTVDSGIAGCTNFNSSGAFVAPTVVNDTVHGLNLASLTPGSIYRFVIDPTLSLGATSATSCGTSGSLRFSFKTVQ